MPFQTRACAAIERPARDQSAKPEERHAADYNGTREPPLGTLHKLISAHSHAIAYEPLDIMLGRFEAAIVGAYYGRLAGGAAPQYTQAGRQIMPSDEGLVKAMLTSLLRSDLDFMKSANLAGYMTTNLMEGNPTEYDQTGERGSDCDLHSDERFRMPLPLWVRG